MLCCVSADTHSPIIWGEVSFSSITMWRAPTGMSNIFSIPSKTGQRTPQFILGFNSSLLFLMQNIGRQRFRALLDDRVKYGLWEEVFRVSGVFTSLFGRLGERQLHGATVRVVSFAHSTFVLLFVRTHLFVAADALGERKGKDMESNQGNVYTHWDYFAGRMMPWENTAHIWFEARFRMVQIGNTHQT